MVGTRSKLGCLTSKSADRSSSGYRGRATSASRSCPEAGECTTAREKAPGKGARLYFHRLGTDPAADREVFGEGYGSSATVWAHLSDDGRYLVAHATSGTSQGTDVFVQNVTAGGGEWLAGGGEWLAAVKGIDSLFYAGVLGDQLVVQTNWQAPRGRIMVADPDDRVTIAGGSSCRSTKRAWSGPSLAPGAGSSSSTWKTSSRGSPSLTSRAARSQRCLFQ